MVTSINMSSLMAGLNDLIATADNVANGRIGQADRDTVQRFSNALHGNQAQTSVGFFDAITRHGGPASSINLDA